MTACAIGSVFTARDRGRGAKSQPARASRASSTLTWGEHARVLAPARERKPVFVEVRWTPLPPRLSRQQSAAQNAVAMVGDAALGGRCVPREAGARPTQYGDGTKPALSK